MRNIEMTVDKNVLTSTVDLSKNGTVSKSGKSHIIASTDGNVYVPERTEKIGLNVYKSVAKPAAPVAPVA